MRSGLGWRSLNPVEHHKQQPLNLNDFFMG